MKLHEVKIDSPMLVAKYNKNIPLEKHNFQLYRSKETKVYFAEQVKELEVSDFTKSRVKKSPYTYGVVGEYVNLNVSDREHYELSITHKLGQNFNCYILEDGYIAIIEAYYFNFYCNIAD